MIAFLTSSPCTAIVEMGQGEKVRMNEENKFVKRLKKYWKKDSRCLVISSAPTEYEFMDRFTGVMEQAVRSAELSLKSMELWDYRIPELSKEDLRDYDVILLAGGHVPTQNAFFREIRLREKLQGYEGIVIGVSAGTMNSAEVVYAMPELPGEAIDPDYQRFLPGLGLTEVMVIPHYNMLRDAMLDGRRLVEDIAIRDSFGRKFLALPDGSYLLIKDGKTKICGPYYEIKNGKISEGRNGK